MIKKNLYKRFLRASLLKVKRNVCLFACCLASITAHAGQSQSPFLNDQLDPEVEAKIDALMSDMSLNEKIGQMSLRDWSTFPEGGLEDEIRNGTIGGFLNVPRHANEPDAFDRLQRIAVEESINGIPLIFGHDVIHGYKTIFPIPLGQAASWSEELIEAGAEISALEASSVGIRWTFAPMIDLSRDPRWGRIAESLGEDVYLTSVLGSAMVRGFQGDDLSSSQSLATCAKHFAAYGAGEAGRDYGTVNMSPRQLHDHYLPPFKAAIDAGAPCLMSSYSELNGIPATADKSLLTDVLREQWEFTGFVVSDWNSVMEMIPHGFARNAREAALTSTNAGLDFEMHSRALEDHLPELIEQGLVSMERIDEAVRRMLRAKIAMGLYETPYTNTELQDQILSDEYLAAAKEAAMASFVLLKNEQDILPLDSNDRVAIIGPMAEVPYQQMGTWVYEGEAKDSRTLLPALSSYLGGDSQFNYAQGLPYSRSTDTSGFAEAVLAAESADVVLFFAGEEAVLTGEGHSRGDISLPGAQLELLEALKATGKPIAMVILSGRPNSLESVLDQVDGLLMAWHPGTMAGPALVDVLYGEQSPSGKLPLTWPKSSGQIPIYYDHKATGRPATDDNYTLIDDIDPATTWQHEPGNSSNHLDYGHTPEFPFGFGLSYSQFSYQDAELKSDEVSPEGTVNLSVRVHNQGEYDTHEIVQIYIQDLFASVTRPVKELKAFERVSLAAGESKTVQFSIPVSGLGFHNQQMEYVVEPGEFKLWVAGNSADERLEFDFIVTAP